MTKKECNTCEHQPEESTSKNNTVMRVHKEEPCLSCHWENTPSKWSPKEGSK